MKYEIMNPNSEPPPIPLESIPAGIFVAAPFGPWETESMTPCLFLKHGVPGTSSPVVHRLSYANGDPHNGNILVSSYPNIKVKGYKIVATVQVTLKV